MPSCQSSENAPADSRRSSMRRLSSIASFQALNPFSRRRSNNKTDTSTAGSSTSNLSLSSTTVNPPQPTYLPASSSSQHLSTHDELNESTLPIPPVPATLASKRSSYICLPDDPIGGMPRSRTFSNLPLPSKSRRNTTMAPSKSHTRLPSMFLPSTRLPSPAVSNRKHSMSKLAAAEAMQPTIRNRVKRSDTEPLLPVNLQPYSNYGRTTAFKENISSSPIKPLPYTATMDHRQMFRSGHPSRGHPARHGWSESSDNSTPLLSSSEHSRNSSIAYLADMIAPFDLSSSPPTLQQFSHAYKPSFSSPAYRRSRDRPATPGKPMAVQRWNSQPVLTNITNRRTSRHGEIQERRLLSELKPILPPVQTIPPLAGETLPRGRARTMSNASQLRQIAEAGVPTEHLENSPGATSPAHISLQQVTTAEPAAYWCGRFSALKDRYSNEEISAHAHLNSPRANSDKMHTPAATTKRMRRALEHLYAQCVTTEARESFGVFQLQYAALSGNAELGRPLQLKMPERMLRWPGSREADGDGKRDRESGEVAGGSSELRKAKFMDKLFGKRRRSLLVG
ncbi:hypothetical protein LTR78_000700 [Recurvomyces mirabilis]|uniref:Uncharacterized protein n=1 Tax=Recurvomyces mirabilis TaxID=574656 RepID=A0AAE0WVY1_9PEZI|nr:hypothetical protein LTR78_000700 [Recurvomyces mirabilis]KAK5158670.1 hypothetical protein LTS14_002778 [Recurvomyces mirabilis]